jgi:hypothetical protein
MATSIAVRKLGPGEIVIVSSGIAALRSFHLR